MLRIDSILTFFDHVFDLFFRRLLVSKLSKNASKMSQKLLKNDLGKESQKRHQFDPKKPPKGTCLSMGTGSAFNL